MEQKWYTVSEAAQYMRMSRRKIYQLCAERALTGYRAGGRGHRRFKKEELDCVLKKDTREEGITEALTAAEDPVLADIWDNELDAQYDNL